MRFARGIPIAAAALALASPAWAESWVGLGGPPGGDVRALAADPRDPRVVYLGTSAGVLYRSDDAGLRWRRLEPGFPLRGMSLDEIVVGPAGDVLVGYWQVFGSGGGVARSRDGGRSFTPQPGIAGESVRALAVAPSDPAVIVAGTLTGVFRSDDGGGAWRRISPPGHAELRNVESVAVDPGTPDTIYAGTWHLLWKTSDGGRSWRPRHAGIVDDSDIFTLTLDRARPGTVYATACTGIYRSGDAGARWSKLRGIPSSSRRTRAFAQDPERPETLFAGTTEGLWSSEDGGASWRLATSQDLVVNAVLVLPGGRVLLGCEGAGVVRSGDGGATWAASNAGFSERLVSRLLLDPAGRLLAGIWSDRTEGGVFAAERADGDWVRLGPGLEGREVLALAVTEGGGIVAGTDDGVFLRRGGDWRRLPTVVDGLDLHPRVADVAALPDGVLLAGTSQGLLRSGDGGATWRRRTLGFAAAVSALAVSPRAPRLVLATTPLGVFRSADAGETWTGVSQGFADAPVRTLVLLPGDDRVVLATTARGLYKSADQGRTWYRRGGGLPQSDIAGLAVAPDGRTLYASDFALGGLYRSEDAGESWRRVGADGLVSDRVSALALLPGRLVAAAAGGGLFGLPLGAPGPAAAAGSR